jgi:hypothetical protein
MSDSRSPRRPPAPKAALDALLADPAGNPIRRAVWLEELDRRLRPHLPPSLAAHAQLSNVERGRLVFVVDAPVWRTKLRFAAPEILDAARSIGLDAVELVVKTALAPMALQAQDRRTQPPISEAAQRELRAALASLEAPVPCGSDDAT